MKSPAKSSARLQSQLLFGVALIVLVTTLSVGSITFYTTRAQIIEKQIDQGRFLGQALANILSSAFHAQTTPKETLPDVIRALANSPAIQELVVVDPHLKLLASSSIQGKAGLLNEEDVVTTLRTGQQIIDVSSSGQSRILSISTPILASGQLLGAVRLKTPVGKEPLKWPLLFWLIMGIDGLILFLFVALVHSRYVIKPLLAIQRAAARVSNGELAIQLPLDGPSELSSLARSFNAMTASVQEKMVRLEKQQQELVASREQLIRSEKLASVGRLAAGVAHEVGNPLQVIIGFTEMILGKELQPREEIDFLQRIRSEAQRIHHIIRELLDYARPVKEAIEPVSLAAAIEQSLKLIKPQKRFQEISIEYEGLTDLPSVAANAQRVVQVLVNLLLNAADAMEGRGKIAFRGEYHPLEERVALWVSNTGPLIPEEIRSHIFDPFFTTKQPGQGTGLGLSIAQSIVESFHGNLELDAAASLTTFIIRFRLWKEG